MSPQREVQFRVELCGTTEDRECRAACLHGPKGFNEGLLIKYGDVRSPFAGRYFDICEREVDKIAVLIYT